MIANPLNRLKQNPRFRRSSAFTILSAIRHPRSGRERRREQRFYRQLLGTAHRGVIFDIGASMGSKAEIFEPFARVICIEPSPAAAARLKDRFPDPERVEIVEAAVSDRAGIGVLLEFEPGSAYNTLHQKWAEALATPDGNRFGLAMPTPREHQVRLVTLEELVARYGQPRYIKIDVEGYEALAIQAMRRPCELVSAEFNLPEFEQELHTVVEHLTRLSKDVRFNVAISEPPFAFEFEHWRTGPDTLERIGRAAWRYVELYARTPVSKSGREVARS